MGDVKDGMPRPDLASTIDTVYTAMSRVEPDTAAAALATVFAAVVACRAFATTDDPAERWRLISEDVLEIRRFVPEAAMRHLEVLDARERKGTA